MDESRLKKSIKAINLLTRENQKYKAPVAIVGVGMQMPGGVQDLQAMWQLLAEGRNTVTDIPKTRWDVEKYFDADPEVPGKSYTNKGSFIDSPDLFDRAFFRASPEEAAKMDPQHRLLLETSWVALENAGVLKSELLESKTGVFVGIGPTQYPSHFQQKEQLTNYDAVGIPTSFSAGRISYFLGLNGPSMAIDTACSSSLTAIHSAVQSLRNGECNMALAGGVNLLLDPDIYLMLAETRSLSPDGICKAFSANADGFGRGEGCGMIVLRPLADALERKDPILGVIKGTAVNHDGASSGITVPSGKAQERVLKDALLNARLNPEQIDYVECHGTGTDLGDPIEVESLQRVYGRGRNKDLLIGSVKSNVGHLEPAAGMAGIIKVLACLQNNYLPKTLHAEKLNPKIDWKGNGVAVLQYGQAWEKNENPRRAGVSSFGISGTNAHIILEEAPAEASEEVEETKLPARPYQLLTVSGEGEEALQGQLAKLKTHIESHSEQSLEALAYGLSTTRSHFRSRLGLVVSDKESLLAKLSGPIHPIRTSPGKLAFLYTGGGSQYTGMAKELYETEKTFATTFDECLSLIHQETGEDFKQIIFASASTAEAAKLDQIDYMLLALFAVEYSLTRLWQSWGIEPDILMGHSLGELVAATVAGVFSLEDGIRLVAARGQLMASVKQAGKMATVEASIAELQPYLDKEPSVSVAGENGPRQTLISGAAAGIESMADQLKNSDIKVKVLPISQASHSPLMEEILPAFRQVASQITYHAPQYPIISNVSGKLAGEEIQSPDYWTDHIRQTVLFSSGMQTLEQEGVTTYLEMGAEPSLVGMGGHCVTNSEDCQWLASLQSEGSDEETILKSVAALYEAGYAPNWDSFYQDREQQKVPLPTYAFQRKRYWIDLKNQSNSGSQTGHALLGSELEIVGQKVYEQELSLHDFPYLHDHQVFGEVVLPGAGLAEIVQGFIHLQKAEADYELTELLIAQPLIIPQEGRVLVQMITEESEDGYEFRLCSKTDGSDWQVHGTGLVSVSEVPQLASVDLMKKKAGLSAKDVNSLYDDYEAIGLSYGPAFQGIEEVYVDAERAFGRVVIKTEQDSYHLHPAILDGVFQLAGAMHDRTDETTYLPFEISEYHLLSKPANGEVWAEIQLESREDIYKRYRVNLWDETGSPIAVVKKLSVRKLDPSSLSKTGVAHADWLYGIRWQPAKLLTGQMREGHWLLTGNDSQLSSALTEALSDQPVTIERTDHNVSVPEGTKGLISFWEVEEDPTDMAQATEELSCLGLMQLQEAIKAGIEEVVWVTQSVYGSKPNLVQSPLWGLLRVAMNEYPDVRFRLIDTAEHRKATATDLAEVIKSTDQENQIRLTHEGTQGLRLTRLSPTQGSTPDLENGTLLITGGLGALGLKVAQHFSGQYKVGHLLLLGRSKPGKEALEVIGKLEAAGLKVTVASCNVADQNALKRVIEDIPAAFPLKAVIHAAVVLDDGILSEQNKERLHTSMLPKVHGAWNLHELTQHLDLELFVLFSSAASWLGSTGQGNYVAANLFLDQLSNYRNALGLASHTINWGPVSDVGLAAELSEADKQRIEQKGIGYFPSSEGIRLLDAILMMKESQTGIIPIRKHQMGRSLIKSHGEVPAFYREVVSAGRQRGDQSLAVQLMSLEAEKREARLGKYLREHIASVLGTEVRNVPVNEPLKSLGVNSLMAVELRNGLGRELAVKLPATLIFDYPTVDDLSGFLLRELTGSHSSAQRAEASVEKTGHSEEEPIAIISMGCRFPGTSNSPEDLWELLANGGDGIQTIPESRWDIDEWYDADPEAPGKMYVREGGFLEGIESFDPSFFKISPEEAKSIDPQQRLLLECCWEALERANLLQSELSNTNTGVYIGISSNDYSHRTSLKADQLDAYSLLGTALSTIVGRVSYWLGLVGPNLAIDTACSSSLVSLHLAVQAIRNGECDQALAGGVNLLLNPVSTVYFSQIKSLSPGGRCHTFSNGADGFIRSEGAGIVLLKPLSKAKADGDNVLALIRGSAINQDGKSQGFTAPNGPSQQEVIRKALQQADLKPEDIDYLECHGTGTSLGDPIEVQSIGEVYKQNTRPVVLGSIKSNIGHTEAAAGIAGVIKTVLSMQHGMIPKSLHSEELNEKIDWEAYPVKVAQDAIPWEKNGSPRRAGVSSFGISGTNAHIILEEAPAEAPEEVEETKLPARSYQLLTLSGEGEEALQGQQAKLKAHIESHSEQSPEALAYSLSTTRSHFRSRLGLVVSDKESLLSKLSGPIHPIRTSPGKLAFLYTGGGSQYTGMAKELYETEKTFATTFDQCLSLIQQETGEDFKQIIFASASTAEAAKLDQIDYMLLALFAVEYSLTRLWQSWGIEPDILMGHSLGELVAATVAGVFSLEDGIRLVAARGKLMASVKQAGKMATVEASIAELQPYLDKEPSVSVAGENGPRQTLISGAAAGIESIADQLKNSDIKVRILPISQASHSPLMEEILPAFRQVAGQVTYHAPQYPIISNVSGRLAGEEIQSPDYWTDHIRQTVLFSSGMQTLEQEGVTTYLEMGAEPSLVGMGGHCVTNSEDCQWLASLQSEGSDEETILKSVAALYEAGYAPNWDSFYQDREQQKVQLPTYAFQRKRYWLEAESNHSGGSQTGHMLLGAELEIRGQKVFEQDLSLKNLPFLEGHQVFGQVIMPATGFIELVQSFVSRTEGDLYLEELLIAKPLILPKEGTVRIQLITEREAEGYSFQIHSKSASGQWLQHASGKLSPGYASVLPSIKPDELKNGLKPKETGALYDDFDQMGISYRSAFQGIEAVFSDNSRVVGKVVLDLDSQEGYHFHPAMLDSVFQLSAIMEASEGTTYLPFEVREYHLFSEINTSVVWAELSKSDEGDDQKRFEIKIWDESGAPVALINGLTVRKTDQLSVSEEKMVHHDWLYRSSWHPVKLTSGLMKSGRWVFSAGQNSSLAMALSGALSSQPITLESITPESPVSPGTTGFISFWEVEETSGDVAMVAEEQSALALDHIHQAIAAGVEEMIWVTRDVHSTTRPVNLIHSPLWGLMRVAMNEYPEVRFRLIDLQDPSEEGISSLSAVITSESAEDQLRIAQEGVVEGLRLENAPLPDTETLKDADNYELVVGQEGNLDSLQLKPAPLKVLGDDEVEVEVKAAGLNFRDVLIALGLYPDLGGNSGFSGEFSGVVSRTGNAVKAYKTGDKVMGLGAGIGRFTVCDQQTLVPIPEDFTFESAATIPAVFLTAWHCLKELGQLESGQKVLIHAAAGGVGMAAIQITQHLGAEVYATCSEAKRQKVRDLGVSHIYDSRSLSFYDDLLEDTRGEKVDLVLNSLIGEAIDKGLELTRPGGKFLEIGRRDIRDKEAVEKEYGVSYCFYNLVEYCTEKPEVVAQSFEQLLSHFNSGVLRALPYQSYPIQKAEQAFRTMSAGKHTGKLVLQMTDFAEEEKLLSEEATVLITGGLGALGLKVAEHLVKSHKVPHLVLLGRSEPKEEAKSLIAQLQAEGARITVETCDVSDRASLEKVISSIPAQYPLKGVIHAAGVLDDGILSKQNADRLHTSMLPKVYGAWHLHELTQHLDLDLFVLFSSVASWLGSVSQGNYAAANLFLDQLTNYRRLQGLTGHTINWGPVSDVGLAAAMTVADKQRVENNGLTYFTSADGLGLLDTILRGAESGVAIVPLRKHALRKNLLQTRGGLPPFYKEVIEEEKSSGMQAVATQLMSLENAQRDSYLSNYLMERVAAVLGTNSRNIPASEPLQSLGVNSLLAVEIRNSLGRSLGLKLPATLMFDYPTIEKLSDYLLSQLITPQEEPKTVDWQNLINQLTQGTDKDTGKSDRIISTINKLRDLVEDNAESAGIETGPDDDALMDLSDEEISEGLDKIFEERLGN